MGVAISADQVLTAGTATARYLRRDYPAGTRIHVFGMDSVHQALLDEGFVLADEDVEVVVATMDLEVTYEKLKRAVVLIRRGARFVATNLDPTRPAPDGMLWPGTGSLIAAIRTGAETDPVVIGKPEATMFQLALEAMGARAEITAMLGDRLDTDILGAQRAGIKTILVLSGSSTAEEAKSYGPDFIFKDIAHLLAAWQMDLEVG
jgi:4-nitrophenyl phosphatase